MQRYIIRKVLDIGYQLHSLTEQGNIINNKLDTVLQNLQISSSHGIENETLQQDIMNKFPIESIEDLQNFEKSLIEGQINRQQLVSAKIKKIQIPYMCMCTYMYTSRIRFCP